MYRVEVWNRRLQRWEPAKWLNPRPEATSAYDDRRSAVIRGQMIYGESRVVKV